MRLFSLSPIEDHEVLEQAGLVIVERLDLDGATRAPARRQESMSVGVGARTDVLHCRALGQLGPPDHERHDTAAIQEHDPPDRASERQIAFAVLEVGVPPHLLRECHVAKQPRHQIRQNVDRRLPALTDTVREVRALRRLLALECFHLDAVLLRESRRGRRRLTVGFERRRHRRTSDELFEVGLTLGQLGDARRQAPWRTVGFGSPFTRQSELLQAGVEMTSQL